jgi:hypothetical protein
MSKHATGKANINIVQSGTPLNNNDRHGALFELPSPFANGRSAVSATASQDETAITSFEVPPVVAAAAVPRDGSSADDVQTDVVSIFVVPTKGAVGEKISEKTVMIDAEHISGENLKKLKVQDPFLYYSIPAAVRNAAVRHREVDMPVLRDSGTGQSTQHSSSDTNRQALSLSSSSPVQVDSEPSSSSTTTTTKFKRKSCISFECSP